jgi:hypothetical protein
LATNKVMLLLHPTIVCQQIPTLSLSWNTAKFDKLNAFAEQSIHSLFPFNQFSPIVGNSRLEILFYWIGDSSWLWILVGSGINKLMAYYLFPC